MAFELDEKEDPATNIKRIARERLDLALESLTAAKGRSEGEKVHTARKRLKEIRAALRLIRGAAGRRWFRRENRAYRDAARPLSELRDARVLIEALDSLVEHFRDELKNRAFDSFRRLLAQRARACRRQVVVEHGALGVVQHALRSARRRIDRWPLDDLDWPVLPDGLAETYRRGRRMAAGALDVESDECFHEWRKQAKYLRHQAEILRPIWCEVMEVLAGQADQLSHLLGDDHDLAVMKGVLRTERDHVAAHERKALLGLIGERRSTLQKHAVELGRKLYAEKPKAFRGRIREYLDAWTRDFAR
jgi:CHAD domain-containing protein